MNSIYASDPASPFASFWKFTCDGTPPPKPDPETRIAETMAEERRLHRRLAKPQQRVIHTYTMSVGARAREHREREERELLKNENNS